MCRCRQFTDLRRTSRCSSQENYLTAETMAQGSKNKRPPERDYSHRLLIDKLGVKAGQRVAVLGVESAEFLTDLTARVPEYSRGKRIAHADLIFFSAET